MRVEQSQHNTHDAYQLIIAEPPKRKNPRRKLHLTTKRYSRRRIALRRKRELAAQKERTKFGEEQSKMENEFSEKENFKIQEQNFKTEEVILEADEENFQTEKENITTEEESFQTEEVNFETEEDFAAYIDLVFDVLEDKDIKNEPDIKSERRRELAAQKEHANFGEEQSKLKNEFSEKENFKIQKQNFKTKGENFKTEEESLKTEEVNFKTEEVNFKTEEVNVKTEEVDFETEEVDFETEEVNFKTEEDFAAYIDLVFDVLEEKDIKKEPDIKSERDKEYILPDEFSNVSEVKTWKVEDTPNVQQKIESGDEEYCVMERELNCTPKEESYKSFTQIKAVGDPLTSLNSELENEKLPIDKWKLELIQCEQQNIESDDGDYYVIEKVANMDTIDNSPRTQYSTDALSIVDMQHVFDQIKAMGSHSKSLDCSTNHLRVANVKQSGLCTTLILECTMCHYKSAVNSISTASDRMNINQSAVAGTIISGGGFAQMEQFLAALNVPCMPRSTYRKCHDEIVDVLIRAAEIEMVAAAEEEKQLAIARGDVLPCGIPHIPVVADGSWIKRSYGTGRFDSPSGAGIIIGYHSKKVLFVGVRNKHCSICRSARKRKVSPRQHRCFRNWGHKQSSTKMESDAILEGFKTSITSRGLVYSTLIADGDSSMYKKILDSDPYKSMVRVKKIECTNHLLRNFCKKMRDVVRKTPPGQYRRAVETSIPRMRTAILIAAKFRFKEDFETSKQVENLCADIINVPSHVFGEHKECQKIGYFCEGTMGEDEQNIVPELLRLGVYQRIQEMLRPLLSHAGSLLYNRTNNLVESFNSLIAKYTGGKRLNFSQRGSYFARCSAAVIQYNTKEVLSCLNRVLNTKPSSVLLNTEKRRKKEGMQNTLRKQRSKAGHHVRKLFCTEDDPDYGPNAVKPDIEELATELGIEQVDESPSSSQLEVVTE